jgi:hypothetical protein
VRILFLHKSSYRAGLLRELEGRSTYRASLSPACSLTRLPGSLRASTRRSPRNDADRMRAQARRTAVERYDWRRVCVYGPRLG